MSEMIERVAKAIMTANEMSTGLKFSDLCRDMARAAIGAMMEPTDNMLRRGSAAAEVCDDGWETNATWMAMINAAVDDLPPGGAA